MTYLGIREWEWMLRTAATPEPSAHAEPDDEFSDIWQNSRGGRNPVAEDWLNNRVTYERPDTAYPSHLRPHEWIGRPQEDLPYGNVQHEETNRSIDGDHEAFVNALTSDQDIPDYGQFSLSGPPSEKFEPTSDERLRSDEGWLLGPGKQFDYPGGRDAIESIHNGMHQRGFDLTNLGSDESPVPGYVHRETGARIAPVHHSDSVGWGLTSPGMHFSEHGNPASAAAEHQGNMAAAAAAETERYRDSIARDIADRYHQTQRSRRPEPGTGAGPRRRESHDYIPKTKAQGMSWGNLFDEAIHGNEGHGREFERAAVKSVHNPSRYATGRLYGVHDDQWKEDHANDDAGRGKVAQAIYHYETPIAWKYHSVQPDGTYDEGKWRVPATSFGSGGWFSTGRVQNLMGPSLRRVDHEYLRDPLVEHRLHRAMEQGGILRSPDQTYSSTDIFGNNHHIAPSQSGQTAVHTVTSPHGSEQFQKRVPSYDAAQNAFQMTQSPGAGGPLDTAGFLKSKGYRQTVGATPRRRRDVPLRLQPELPFRNSSVASWSDSLRG